MNRGYRRQSDITKKSGRIKKIKLEGEGSFSHLDAASFPSQFHRNLSSDSTVTQQAVSIILPGKTPPNKQTCSYRKKHELQNWYWKELSHNMLINSGLLLNIGMEDLNAFSRETLRIVSFKSNQFGWLRITLLCYLLQSAFHKKPQ